MFFLPILIGVIFGSIIFMFTFIASKKNGAYYLAPIITFLSAVALTAYGLIVVGGFEGMGYGVLAFGFLLVSIGGSILLPFLIRRESSWQFRKKDKISLIILPCLFFVALGLLIYSDQGYWVIDQGVRAQAEEDGQESYYEVSTISEGRKQVELILGEEYAGKEIEVERVSKLGPTEITVNIVDVGDANKPPYIMIGIDEIRESLTVQTTDDIVFQPADNVN